MIKLLLFSKHLLNTLPGNGDLVRVTSTLVWLEWKGKGKMG